MKYVVAAFAGLLIASSATAQTILLHPGETVTVRFDNGQAVVEGTTPAQPMGKYDAYVLWRAESEQIPPGAKTVAPQFIMRGEGPPDPPRPIPDRIQLTFRDVPGLEPASQHNSALVIANGSDSKFSYRAVIHRQGSAGPTDVCQVLPAQRGLEHWPYVIEQLDISDLRLMPADGQVSCH